MSPLRWTSKSTVHLADTLRAKGFEIGPNTVADLLSDMGYSLQGTSKQKEGAQHVDRDAQFHYINDTAVAFMADNQPVMSVDAKKKELIGEYSNAGKEYQPKGRAHPDEGPRLHRPRDGQGHPLRRLRPGRRRGMGLGGRRRRYRLLRSRHHRPLVGPDGTTPLSRSHPPARLRRCRWVQRLPDPSLEGGAGQVGQRDRLGDHGRVTIPPGTSKWNKIEHRLFSFITMNWRGRPLTSYRVMIQLIANTTTKKGLKVNADLDQGYYPVGVKITNKELAAVPLTRHDFHGDWNYTVHPELRE